MKQNKWTKEQLEALTALAEELQQEAQPQLTVQENMRDALRRRAEGVDADKVTRDLCRGIDAYHETMKAAQASGFSAVAHGQIDAMLQERTEEEQAAVLSEILSAFAEATGQPAPSPSAPAQLDDLKAAVCTYLEQYSVLQMDIEATALLLQELGEENLESLRDATARAQRAQYVALALYLQKILGDQDILPSELSAEEIGAITAANLDANETMLEGLLGNISWESVKAKLKLIAGAALLTLLAIVTVKLTVAVGALTFLLVQSFVGLGVIGVAVAAIFGVATATGFAQQMLAVGQKINEVTHVGDALASLFDKLNTWIQQTVRPAAERYWARVRPTQPVDVSDATQIADSMPEEDELYAKA